MADEPVYETPEAGALWGLYYALYHAPGDWWRDNVGNLPDGALLAYARVQKFARESQTITDPSMDAVWVGDYIDPLRYVTTKEESRG